MKLAYLLGLLVAFAACVTDLRSRRIPNVLTFGATAAALVFHAVTGQASGLLQSVEGWLVGVAIFFSPFALGGLGAGDVKLLAALGALGRSIGRYVDFALHRSCGWVLALVVAASTGYLREALSNVWLLISHWSVAGIGPLREISLEGGKGPRLGVCHTDFRRDAGERMASVLGMHRRWRSDSAPERIEFALAFPLLLLVVFGIIDFGVPFQQGNLRS